MAEEFSTELKNGNILTPKGFKAGGIHSGVKRKRNDLGIIYCEKPAIAAAVYTLNKVVAAPITVTKATLKEAKKVQAVVVNSGNANACTGEQGILDAKAMQKLTAETFRIQEEHVAVASTGVIGELMPMDKIAAHIPQIDVGETEAHAKAFGEAILTTDTFAKSASFQTTIDGKMSRSQVRRKVRG